MPVEVGSVGINPVINYSNMTNYSLVKLRNDITAKNINVKSNITLDNPRLEQVKAGILKIKPRLAKAYDSIINKAKNAGDAELNTALDEAKTRLDNYLKKLDGSDGCTIAAASIVNIMNNNSAIMIEPMTALNAKRGNINIDSTLKNVSLSVGGYILPQSLDTAATDIIVGVNNVVDSNTVTFAGGNQLSGNNISITANNKINHIYLNDGSGKGVNNSLRAAGTVSYAGGLSTSTSKKFSNQELRTGN